jgi:hypothetical protein
MRNRRTLAVSIAALSVVPLALVPASTANAAPSGAAAASRLARSAELSETSRLADRRSFVIGDRFYEVGAEDGSYPAEGFHTRGEMGGFWSMPIKLLDGVWFGVNGTWLSAAKYTSGWGYSRWDLGTQGGVQITRTDVAPDGLRAGLIGLTMTSSAARTVTLTMDAHSELMKAYPWGQTVPSQLVYNLPDTGSYAQNSLVFREQGTPPVPNAEAHNYAAVVGSTLTPTAHALGPNFRGPQDPAVICPPSDSTATQPDRCDDTAYGKGTGGQLTYSVKVPAGSKTVWFAIGGSDNGLGEARSMQQQALANPAGLLAAKVSSRKTLNSQTDVSLPGDPQLAESVAWSKQNIADARQESRNLQLRVTNAGTVYPAPVGTLAQADWIGAGWPDYPWLFGTDGEYTAFAAVASGQFQSIENHLMALKNVSDIVNENSGKVVHEVVPDGSVYFGANSDNGNTDETVKFPSAVALVWRWTGDNKFRDSMYDFVKRNLNYVFTNLVDQDGWLVGAGNVEREGMGPAKLDNTVYAIRGLLDLVDMAQSKGDAATVAWAAAKAKDLQSRFEKAWWNGSDTKSYADSLSATDQQIFQRYWIGLTPIEAELPATATTPAGPVASLGHARTTVAQHERPCYTGPNGLYHTGTGATTSTTTPNPGPTCDNAVSTAPSERDIFTLTTSIAAVAEAALGRMGANQMQRYTDDNARVQVDPSTWEVPGAMPEISPSPDFGSNIDKKFTERSSGLQSWGAYGVLWPVVHYELGVAPDLGHKALAVVPQVPDGQTVVSATNIRLGNGSIAVTARRSAHLLTTIVLKQVSAALTSGVLLPAGTHATSVLLNGHAVDYRVVTTARGTEVLVSVPNSVTSSRLEVRYR